MSKAEELLDSLSIEDIEPFTSQPDIEGHIVIDKDRIIRVPTELKRIAVQYDANIETVTFDCPRYWDEHDLSQMNIYINYKLPGNLINNIGQSLAKNVRINEDDENIINFDWTIGPILTNNKGDLPFSVCAKSKTNQDSDEAIRWYTEINTELTISEGMDGSGDIEDNYEDLFPDIINDIISKLEGINDTYDEKLHAFNANATSKTESFDTNAQTRTTEFNNNAAQKTLDYNNNCISKTNSFNQNSTQKVTEFNDNYTSKLDSFNNNADLRMDEYNANADLVLSSIPKNNAEGTDNTFDDGLEGPLYELTVDGSSEQVTTTGKNLYNYEDTMSVGNDITVDEEGYITISYDNSQGESIVYENYFTKPISLLKANTNYSLFAEVKSVSGQGHFTMVSPDAQSSVQQFNLPSVGNLIDFTDINNGEIIKKDYMSKENLNDANINIGVRTFVYFDAGQSGSITFRISLLENTSITSENFVYEPYTGGQPSPSPDYPQEITTLTFDKISRYRKNLATENFQSLNDTINLARTVKTGEKLTIVLYVNHLSDSVVGHGINIYLDDDKIWENENTGWEEPNNGWNSFVITVNKDINKLHINAYGLIDNVEIPTAILSGALVEENKYVADGSLYEPYQGQTYDIDLQGNEMVEIPNGAKDELVIDKQGNVSLIKNVGKFVCDGSEDWKVSQNSPNLTNRFSLELPNLTKNYEYAQTWPIISDYFTTYNFNYIYRGDIVGISGYRPLQDKTSNSSLIFGLANNMTLEEFKSWLQSHNTIAYYELTEPQTIPLGTLSELITTLNGTNNISINGNIPTMISTTYALDIKKYIDNKIAEISTAMIEEG